MYLNLKADWRKGGAKTLAEDLRLLEGKNEAEMTREMKRPLERWLTKGKRLKE